MEEVSAFFNGMPLFTRYWFGGSLAIPLLCRLGMLHPLYMILTPDFLSKFQLWKPVTAALYYPLSGPTGFHYLTNMYFMYNYSKRLEIGYFFGRPADYLFMLLFNWFTLVMFGYFFSMPMLMDPMVMSVIYMYCILNQEQIVTFWFGSRFKARYLPWVLFGINFILGGGGMSELVGIIVGHLYYFVMIRYPQDQGVQLIETPRILYTYFPNDSDTPTGAPTAPRPVPFTAPGVTRTTAYTQSNSHDWGRGRRLED